MSKKRDEAPMREVKLNKAEVAEAAALLSVAVKELEELEIDWSAQRKEHREAKTGVNERIYMLAKQVRTCKREEPAQMGIPSDA